MSGKIQPEISFPILTMYSSTPSGIRAGPIDAEAFRGHRLYQQSLFERSYVSGKFALLLLLQRSTSTTTPCSIHFWRCGLNQPSILLTSNDNERAASHPHPVCQSCHQRHRYYPRSELCSREVERTSERCPASAPLWVSPARKKRTAVPRNSHHHDLTLSDVLVSAPRWNRQRWWWNNRGVALFVLTSISTALQQYPGQTNTKRVHARIGKKLTLHAHNAKCRIEHRPRGKSFAADNTSWLHLSYPA